ncbi:MULTISPECIES: hypothetical protein [Dictyoglomus]|uniref:hypothetical protein n=1 Tax=Dictyoglomus TaxID=13 RepID=UPI0001827D3A|nr:MULTISPECIES: hypothetical protein [Dictyoglomus]HBU31220.1 hypothetical protein [Dictyoglomus sp.]
MIKDNMTKKFIEDVWLMDVLYFEDLDWSKMAKRKGYKLAHCWRSRIYHKEGGSIGSSSKGLEKSKLSNFYGMRK